MKVQILRGYRGKASGERYLEKGEHDLEPGLAKYLVNNGHAAYADLSERSDIPKGEQTKRAVERMAALEALDSVLDAINVPEEPEDTRPVDPNSLTKSQLRSDLDAWGWSDRFTARDNHATLVALWQEALSEQS